MCVIIFFFGNYIKKKIDIGTELFLSKICDLVIYFNLLPVVTSFGRNNRSTNYHLD